MTDDELHRIAAMVGGVVESRLADVATKDDLAAMATKDDIAALHTRFDRLEVKINERFDSLESRVGHLETQTP